MGTSVRKMYDAELLQLDTMLARMGHAAGGADVGGHAFQGLNGAGARFFSDFRLFGGGDVHDHTALEHFGKAGLEADGALFHSCTPSMPGAARRMIWRIAARARDVAGVYICDNQPTDNTSAQRRRDGPGRDAACAAACAQARQQLC